MGFREQDGTSTAVGRALNKKAIVASARFIAVVNKQALPMMSAHFVPLSTQIIATLKAVQPATRLLQVHCTMVKERLQTAALQPAAILKRELEAFVFQVTLRRRRREKRARIPPASHLHRICISPPPLGRLAAASRQVKLLLRENNAQEGFWMGNLKHKAISGKEVSSQMAIEEPAPKEAKEPKKAKGKSKKRKKGEEEEAEEGEEEGGGEGEEAAGEEDEEGEPPAGVMMSQIEELEGGEEEEGEEEDDDDDEDDDEDEEGAEEAD